MHKDFVYLTDIDSTMIESPRYYGAENFVGRPVPGYTSPRIICTERAGRALQAVHAELKTQGYNLVVYDAYRPQRAVNAFVQWSQDAADQSTKKLYYPTLNKSYLFDLGYLCARSSHSRGGTFDLSIIPIGKKLGKLNVIIRTLSNGDCIPFLDDNTLDMGSSFDLFHEVSHHDSGLISGEQAQNRNILRAAMRDHGFAEIKEEWWHYTLRDESYPDTYFDFEIA